MVKINFTKTGMGIEEGTLVRWLKGVGDHVNEGDVIAEIETAKAVQEVEAPASGFITEISVTEGETVAVNSTLGLIGSQND
jgi:pyruvate/2-oxoglutarate dehydrogenase complex dihydrolipoamide acyltransferase (E2) component